MPVFIDTPLDGVGYTSQGFHNNHGAWDVVGPHRTKIYLAGDCVAAYRLPQPPAGQTNHTFGNMLHIIHADGLHEGIAHLDEFDYNWPEGTPLQAGTFLGYQGYTGLTDPDDVVDGSHIHWSVCTVWPFPAANAGTIHLFRNPGDFLISEAERMAIFSKLEELERTIGQFTGGPGDTNNTRMKGWVSGGNIGLLDCLGSQPGELVKFPGVRDQTYGLNDLLSIWRQSLASQNIIVP